MSDPDLAWQKDMSRRIKKYDVPCKGYKHGNPLDGLEWDCDYEKAESMECSDCICNGGYFNPITGKRCYKRRS